MPGPERNDPCPCGSGRKYKRCCLAAHEAASLDGRRLRAVPRAAMEKLWRLGEDPALAGFHESAMAVFWGSLLDGLDPDEAEGLLRLEHAEAGYTAWVLFDLPTPAGSTVAERLLAGEGESLEIAERQWLEAMVASHVALYEVQAVRAGEGLTLRGLWTDRVLDVQERAASRQLVQWDIVAARVIPVAAGGPLVLEGGIYALPASAKGAMLKSLRLGWRSFQRRVPDAAPRDFFKRHGFRFHHFWLDHVLLAQPPRLVTPEGDAVHLARAVFDVADPGRLRAALSTHPGIEDLGGGDYRWTEPAGTGQRVLGTLRLAVRHLTVETLSLERAAQAQRLIEHAAGDAVRYRATTVEGSAKAPRRPAPSPDVPADIAARAVREFKAEHYAGWPDQPLPALGGRTPRAAARLKAWRPRLVDLLKWLENQEARGAAPDRPAYDFGWIWQELDLAPAPGPEGGRGA